MEYSKNQQGKYTAIALVRTFFGAQMQEMKDLPAKDRTELASGIARLEGFKPEDCGFELVEY